MGFFSRPDMADSVHRALDMGFEVVGGIPHLEPTAELGRASITALCEIAADRGAMVDMHCDENDDPNSRMIETLVYETRRLGLQGRVTGSHLTSMHSMDNFYGNRLVGMIAEAGVHVMANPPANLHLQARFDSYPKRRGLARVPELIAAGCKVGLAQDSVLDPWYPLGRCDLLDIAWIAAHTCHMTDRAGLRNCFEAVTSAPARIMGLDSGTLTLGAPAGLVVLDATDPIEAIRLRPTRTHVLRRGQIICQTTPASPQPSVKFQAVDLVLGYRLPNILHHRRRPPLPFAECALRAHQRCHRATARTIALAHLALIRRQASRRGKAEDSAAQASAYSERGNRP